MRLHFWTWYKFGQSFQTQSWIGLNIKFKAQEHCVCLCVFVCVCVMLASWQEPGLLSLSMKLAKWIRITSEVSPVPCHWWLQSRPYLPGLLPGHRQAAHPPCPSLSAHGSTDLRLCWKHTHNVLRHVWDETSWICSTDFLHKGFWQIRSRFCRLEFNVWSYFILTTKQNNNLHSIELFFISR